MPGRNTYDDALLIQQLRQNDAAAYIELYNRYHLKMYSWLISFVKLPELAEDIIQETFLKVWEIRHRLNPELSFPAFLYRISRNRAFKLLKKISLDETLRKRIQIQVEIESNDPEKRFQWLQYQQLLDNAVSRLPAQRQRVFKLCRQNNKTYDEVANELGISRNTVKEHMVKAMQDIRQYFYRYDEVSFIMLLCIML
ncbi:MAG: RNA polymerase sigma-70 factor [Chitinophagaceae bacterium]|nr:RNA polymerase sigma-70 factor [Chitinophagaceae bacterium]MCW5929541.1 RNA polymerase sigma-70 factor [Chitinophagaceae bacterium]